ncbi:MAG: hypothetical protein R3B55_02720 [Candidatus Paceibacterota bacterium]
MVVLVVFVLIRRKQKIQWKTNIEIGQAMVDSVDVTLKESFPVQVDDGKRQFTRRMYRTWRRKQQLVGNTFNINLETKKLKDSEVMCTEALVPFEKNIPLENVVGISAGEYIVNVNGVTKVFKMDVDNYISNEDPK